MFTYSPSLLPLQSVQSSLHARDNEIMRLTRRLDTSKSIESETELKASAVQVRRLRVTTVYQSVKIQHGVLPV